MSFTRAGRFQYVFDEMTIPSLLASFSVVILPAVIPPARCTAIVGIACDAVTAIVVNLGLSGDISNVFLAGVSASGDGGDEGVALRNTRAGGN